MSESTQTDPATTSAAPKEPPPSRPGSSAGPDPELAALPEPRKPWRRATLATLSITTLLSLTLCGGLMSQMSYALRGGQPTELGELADFNPAPQHENSWVHGRGMLQASAVGYRRPLESDRFRLAKVAGSDVWVEMREPEGSLSEHFMPPSSFIGRLVPLSSPGLRHESLTAALTDSGQRGPDDAAWLLIDGESPAASRWVFGVFSLLLGFACFGAWSIFRLLAKVHNARS